MFNTINGSNSKLHPRECIKPMVFADSYSKYAFY